MEENCIVLCKETNLKGTRINRILMKNKVVLRDGYNLFKSSPNHVNLNAWINTKNKVNNIGDYLSYVIVKNMCEKNGIDPNTEINDIRHLYAIGSIILGGYQDATIWGSGFGVDMSNSRMFKINSTVHKIVHKTDVRAVRGPVSREILLKMGIDCPEVYGDPAILLPLFYPKETTKEKEFTLIPHYSLFKKWKESGAISTFTDDWKSIVDEICKSKLVISSSLHGIILAEAYGVPAIMLNDVPKKDLTKYNDYYFSTGRYEYLMVDSIEEALTRKVEPLDASVVEKLQNQLIDSFPTDLWK